MGFAHSDVCYANHKCVLNARRKHTLTFSNKGANFAETEGSTVVRIVGGHLHKYFILRN